MKERLVFVTLTTQLVLALIAVAVGCVWKGQSGAYSAMWGGLAAIIPAAIFAWILGLWRSVKDQAAQPPEAVKAGAEWMMVRFAAAWFWKLIATCVIFIVALKVGEVNAGMMLLAYVLALMGYWPSLLMMKHKQKYLP